MISEKIELKGILTGIFIILFFTSFCVILMGGV